jgi:hypothetical protein
MTTFADNSTIPRGSSRLSVFVKYGLEYSPIPEKLLIATDKVSDTLEALPFVIQTKGCGVIPEYSTSLARYWPGSSIKCRLGFFGPVQPGWL